MLLLEEGSPNSSHLVQCSMQLKNVFEHDAGLENHTSVAQHIQVFADAGINPSLASSFSNAQALTIVGTQLLASLASASGGPPRAADSSCRFILGLFARFNVALSPRESVNPGGVRWCVLD